ncbi:MAG: aminodeoxychorismate synthase component I, partial [Endozoicomonas sp.]
QVSRIIRATVNAINGHTAREDGASLFPLLSRLVKSMTPVNSEGLPFTGGVLGYWAYEYCQLQEPEKIEPREHNAPLASVGLYHWALIVDHKRQKTRLVFHPDITPELKSQVLHALDRKPSERKDPSFQLEKPFTGTQSREEYNQSFDKIQNYIAAGDCYEINLTQEFTAPFSGDTWEAYKHLRTVGKAPYSAYIQHNDVTILSHSPEQFVRLTDCHVETNPIKGTRRRGVTPEEDRSIAHELKNSEKDKAENLMIVDLMRNDLGKVCTVGSVSVPRLFALETYSNVHHLVSTITGNLAEGSDAASLLASTFPGGSITGAPKIRSMEIIRELEPVPRSIYCGSVGYINCNGNMDTSITIRTLLAYDQQLHCWGGGAIVADSNADDEYQESITKVSHLMNALEHNFQPTSP